MNDRNSLNLNKVVKASTLILQVGLSVLCPIILLMSLGIYLDDRFCSGSHWFLFGGIICGVYSAYRSTYFLIRDTMHLKQRETEKNDETI